MVPYGISPHLLEQMCVERKRRRREERACDEYECLDELCEELVTMYAELVTLIITPIILSVYPRTRQKGTISTWVT